MFLPPQLFMTGYLILVAPRALGHGFVSLYPHAEAILSHTSRHARLASAGQSRSSRYSSPASWQLPVQKHDPRVRVHVLKERGDQDGAHPRRLIDPTVCPAPRRPRGVRLVRLADQRVDELEHVATAGGEKTQVAAEVSQGLVPLS